MLVGDSQQDLAGTVLDSLAAAVVLPGWLGNSNVPTTETGSGIDDPRGKRCFHLQGSHPSSPRTGQSSRGTRHLPSAIPDSEFGDPELDPLCMRDMLRNATFFGFFENLGNQVFDASS